MLHVDNAYYIPHLSVVGRVYKTNLPSNTAFRGFGGPQGMAVIETIIDRVARQIGKDVALVRRLNFYGQMGDTTHYGQTVENNRLLTLYDQLMDSSEYEQRRVRVHVFNQENEFFKKGLAITPVRGSPLGSHAEWAIRPGESLQPLLSRVTRSGLRL